MATIYVRTYVRAREPIQYRGSVAENSGTIATNGATIGKNSGSVGGNSGSIFSNGATNCLHGLVFKRGAAEELAEEGGGRYLRLGDGFDVAQELQ